MKKSVFETIGFIGVLLSVGTIGSMECNTINTLQGLIQSAFGVTMMIVGILGILNSQQ